MATGTKVGRKRVGVAPHVQDAMEVTRFWRLVSPPDGQGCRDWQGDTDTHGYGIFVWRSERFPAHELALTFTTGEIRAEGLETCHACDRPICCAPEHLRFDTPKSNTQDCLDRFRHGSQQPPTPEFIDTVELIRTRRAAGAGVRRLAVDYQCSEGWISLVCRGKRYPELPGPIVASTGTGPKNGRARASDEYIQAVRERRAAGETSASIAATIDHSADWVGRVTSGSRYPDAPGPIRNTTLRTHNEG